MLALREVIYKAICSTLPRGCSSSTGSLESEAMPSQGIKLRGAQSRGSSVELAQRPVKEARPKSPLWAHCGDTDSGREEEPCTSATYWVLGWPLLAITHSLVPTTLQSRCSSHHAEEETGCEVKPPAKGYLGTGSRSWEGTQMRREGLGLIGRKTEQRVKP